MNFFENNNILITGATGFLGGHTCKKLMNQKANVYGLYHDLKKDSYLKSENLIESITLINADINDFTRMKEIIARYEIQYIFHYAANSIVKTCVNDPLSAFKTNILGTASILEACLSCKDQIKGFLCMESDKSYGSFDKRDLPYKEDQPIKPQNIYEVSKACAGMVARSYYYNFGLPIFIVRAANLYGPGDFNFSRIIPRSVKNLENNISPILYNGVENFVREFLYVEDAASHTIELMKNISNINGEIINIGSGVKTNIKNLINDIIKLSKKNLEIKYEHKEENFKEIELQYLDINKFNTLIPNASITNLNDGLKKTYKWYKDYFLSSTQL